MPGFFTRSGSAGRLAGHYWTIAPFLRAALMPRSAAPARPWSTTLEDPATGEVRLSGFFAPPARANKGLLLVVHGLGGSAESAYMTAATHAARRRGARLFATQPAWSRPPRRRLLPRRPYGRPRRRAHQHGAPRLRANLRSRLLARWPSGAALRNRRAGSPGARGSRNLRSTGARRFVHGHRPSTTLALSTPRPARLARDLPECGRTAPCSPAALRGAPNSIDPRVGPSHRRAAARVRKRRALLFRSQRGAAAENSRRSRRCWCRPSTIRWCWPRPCAQR